MIDSNHDHSLPPFESQVLGGGRGSTYDPRRRYGFWGQCFDVGGDRRADLNRQEVN